ncbi:unnamed protein product [Eruca vesicaria subsp. sativa]|uniref:Phorbol-ester/DAG-type domain-containing protein n=1 Tax=Eruca vesicaria subsp. sativa TaxID=29727 RepID=A0ABC8L7U5_ERUVS|nr:unnamed protein product [Eruca vesicaria subsp. sativa]
MIRIKLPTHKHPLYPTPWVRICDGCYREGGYKKDGYRCYECRIYFHKECAESSLEINHPSHPEHPLHLYIIAKKYSEVRNCKLCGEKLYHIFYHCPLCEFVVDTACIKNQPPYLIEHPKAHKHSLVHLKNVKTDRCDFCGYIFFSRYLYKCFQCQLKFHFECLNLPLEITHPCHPKHPLKFLTREEHYFLDGKCCICGDELWRRFYHCSICKFSVDLACVRNPPPLTILFAKTHDHKISLMPRIISFNCDVCGMNGDRSPYSCQRCDFMIHQSCIDLPEIINVNRHEHRVSRRLHLYPGNWICGVCYKKVDWSYGAYSCSICPNYAIHSTCAIEDEVWDKLELKGTPEEVQEIKPFKVIGENLIHHFSHEEHYLQLNEEQIKGDGNVRCEACVLPINYQAFYSCVQCDFILHKTCANLPRKKRHMYNDKPFILKSGGMTQFNCSACYNWFSGFRYRTESFNIDVKCSELSEPIFHESHGCPLYYIHRNQEDCIACGRRCKSTFKCNDCKFVLGTKCVVLPKTTKHWYDEHILSLCYDNHTKGELCCDVCEESIEKYWFYKCDICCVAFHTKCVLGDLSLLMPGRSIITYYDELRIEVMQTSPSFLPRCYYCRSRRAVPFVLRAFYPKQTVLVCSSQCFLYNHLGTDHYIFKEGLVLFG